MARPIRNTPILWGNDAREFIRRAESVVPTEEGRREMQRIKESVRKLEEFLREHGAYSE